MTLSRRDLIRASALSALSASLPRSARAAETTSLPDAIAGLKPMTAGLLPISPDERAARRERAKRLMAEKDLDAIVLASGASLSYFTGAEWGLSERFFGAVLTREGDPAWVAPAFEAGRAREQIQPGADLRVWEEHESPYDLVAAILKDRGAATGKIGLDETMPFVYAERLSRSLPAARISSAIPVTAGCRMIKDAHEVALMRRSCEITVHAHRAVFASLKEGMTQDQVASLSATAHEKLGVKGGSLVLFGPDAAFPHGTKNPRPLRLGDIVLVDGGGRLHGYCSDITRSGVFGQAPTERQRRIFEVVHKAQLAAVAAARPGVECQAVDQAARTVIEDAGFGSGYKALTHRLGHGIGLEGHEWTYLVKGNDTKLRSGMCFSDEPGIYIPGELGLRLEDIIHITDDGCENLTRWAGTPEDPAVV